MGFINSPNIFQENKSKLFEGFLIVRVYIDNAIVMTKHDFADHLKYLEKYPQKRVESGLRLNAENSFFVFTGT